MKKRYRKIVTHENVGHGFFGHSYFRIIVQYVECDWQKSQKSDPPKKVSKGKAEKIISRRHSVTRGK